MASAADGARPDGDGTTPSTPSLPEPPAGYSHSDTVEKLKAYIANVPEAERRLAAAALSSPEFKRMLGEAPVSEPAATAAQDPQGPHRPRLYAVREIREMDHVAREWIVEGLVARGNITMFAGVAKTGKSTFMAAAVAAVLDGRLFAGMATTSATVLYVTEEGLVSFDELMRRVCVPDTDDLKVMPRLETWGMEWPALCAEIGAYVRDERFGLVVVDTLDNLAGIIDQNDAGEARAAVSHLRPVAETGAAVWISRHNIKNETGNPVKDAAGSGSFSGAVDIVAGYYKKGRQREIKAVGRLDGIPDSRLVEFDGIEFSAGTDPAERRDLEFERLVIAAIPRGEANARTAQHIAGVVGSYRQKVQPLLNKLRDARVTSARRGAVAGAGPQAIGYWMPE